MIAIRLCSHLLYSPGSPSRNFLCHIAAEPYCCCLGLYVFMLCTIWGRALWAKYVRAAWLPSQCLANRFSCRQLFAVLHLSIGVPTLGKSRVLNERFHSPVALREKIQRFKAVLCISAGASEDTVSRDLTYLSPSPQRQSSHSNEPRKPSLLRGLFEVALRGCCAEGSRLYETRWDRQGPWKRSMT